MKNTLQKRLLIGLFGLMILHPVVLIEAEAVLRVPTSSYSMQFLSKNSSPILPTKSLSGVSDNVCLEGALNANINAPIEGSDVRISNVPLPLFIVGAVTAAYVIPIIASTTAAIAKDVAKKVSEGSAKIYRAAPKIAATSMLLISGWYAYNTTSYAQAFWTVSALVSAGCMGYYYAKESPAQAVGNHARPHAGLAINHYYNAQQ